MSDSGSRETADTVEMPAITDDDADAYAGPACGTPEAITHLWASYHVGDMLHISRGRYCCARHIPKRAEIIPDIGELASIVMLDGWLMTNVKADGQVDTYVNSEDEPGADPWWPNDNAIMHLGATFSPPLP